MLVVTTLTPSTRSIDLDALVTAWTAANYLTVAQIYLQANPLLRDPLRAEHIKPRLLGHWGTSPALSLIYVQLNRLIQQRDCDVLYIAGPGHGGPAIVANVYLEGTYSDIYPAVSLDEPGLLRLVRQFSTPGGIPSYVSVPTPGSIHEGGELGYALVHAFGAVFDNPDLIAACVVGDGEAETGPLEGSWKGVSFLDPRRDGAVLPILQLNGYKISGPTVLGRAPERDVRSLLSAHGYDVHVVSGDEPRAVHEEFAQTLDRCYDRIREIQAVARQTGVYPQRVPWPAIVLRTPKGWTGPKFVDGMPVEGTFRAHQVPLDNVRSNAAHLAQLEEWMRSYRPETLFDDAGAPVQAVTAVVPRGDKRMGASAYANGGRLLRPLRLPEFTEYAMSVDPGVTVGESTRRLGEWIRDIYRDNPDNFRLFCPDETNSNRLGAVFDIENRCFEEQIIPIDDHVRNDGRVMEVLSEHLCEGWLEGYLLTGRHGLFATYEAFAMVSASMTVQHAKWLEAARGTRLACPGRRAERAAHVDVLAQRSQRLQPSGSGAHRHRDGDERRRGPSLSAAGRELPPVGGESLHEEPQLREPDRHRQATGAPVSVDGCRRRALRARCLGVGLGIQPGWGRAGRRARLRRRHPDARNACRCCAAARSRA